MSARPTITEVAQRAGVSIASVSRVLNGIPARPATEERVRAAVAELGYIPHVAGKSLKLGPTTQIAFAVDDVANPVYTQMMRGVEEGLTPSGARLLVSSTGRDPDDLMSLVASLSRGYCDGLIISPLRRTPELLDALANAPVPVVVIGDVGGHPALDCVTTDSRAGVGLAYAHLVESGRRRIGFVNGPADTTPARLRLAGFTQAAQKHGHGGPVVEAKDFTVAAGEAAWHLLPTSGRGAVDAVIAVNDLVALGVMRAAIADGSRVPGKLAVVGTDDIEFAAIFSPSLTTISLGAERRGLLAAKLLLARMEHPQAPARTELVKPTLVVRESSAPKSGGR